MDALSQSGDGLADIVRDAADAGDVAEVIGMVGKLTENVQTRTELADRLRRQEHRELAEVVRELASAFVLHSPTKAPGVVAAIIEGRACATVLLEDLDDHG
ncbi:hypothetical protein [Ruegeria sp. Ofav3-42]|uniref:hypothetical protein n=1 Tax=Ruegeria sp. Ofav3-42 TaxID=2917759 RepID=UPI001EF50C14|nr:hypothetical protein [Ruegeria sp. Ofav3-42]MCG7521611.1 hypothetical protein [Ruegeria sp. Ofav3-42]